MPSRRHFRLVVIVVVWIVTLASGFWAGVSAYRNREELRTYIIGAVRSGGIIRTNLYDLSMTTLSVPGEGRDGGIAALDDGVLFVNRRGVIWFISGDKTITRLGFGAPVNIEEFERDGFNRNTDRKEQFAAKDVLVQPLRNGMRLLVSHNYWYAEQDCYVLRVSAIEGTEKEIRDGSSGLGDRWHTLFETSPCLPLESWGGMVHVPSMDAGGRLVALSEDEILVSVGHFAASDIRDLDNSYGKVISVKPSTGESRIYTVGHRNPQGMTVASDGTVWLTEHGPRGGDELNRIIAGRDYGFPIVTYGTEYESLSWPTNPRQGRHDGFERPVYAWVPSIGVSQLTEIGGELFSRWKGDLLVASLDGRRLFRVRLEEERVVLVEPVTVGHRVRDIVQMNDGTIALKTDDDLLVFLQPVDSTKSGEMYSPAERGEIISSACAGCHALTPEGTSGIGPSLWGIVGRRIGSADGFSYSAALASLTDRWTPDRLREYIREPQSFAPGTQMVTTAAYSSAALDDLIAFLETLR